MYGIRFSKIIVHEELILTRSLIIGLQDTLYGPYVVWCQPKSNDRRVNIFSQAQNNGGVAATKLENVKSKVLLIQLEFIDDDDWKL